MKIIKLLILFIFIISKSSIYGYNYNIYEKDIRKVKDDTSPPFLNTVGSIGFIDGQNKFKNINVECGGILASINKSEQADTILTSNHCLLNKRNMEYTWKSDSNNKRILRKGKVIYSNEKYDLAVIKLYRGIENQEIKPLLIDPLLEIPKNALENYKNFFVTGYSTDNLGGYGRYLTYENPKYILWDNEKKFSKVGSIIFQGDSGGAVIFNNKKTNQSYLIGVISFILKDKNIFVNEKNKYGNISGYFSDILNNNSIIEDLKKIL